MNSVNPRTVLTYVMISLWIAFGVFFFPIICLGEKEKNHHEEVLPDAVITIQVRENQSIRDISDEYLHDPDLWEDLLHANHLKFAHEISPGMTLRIPAGAIFQANKGLERSQQMIQQANRAGAKLFAPELITHAIQLRNTAIEKRKGGEWEACIKLTDSAADQAEKALDISTEKQDVPAEAVITYCYGKVHRRKPSDNIWKEISQYQILQEGDRIRTLSQSYAHILFRDDSRLYLKENSQALIRRMRANLLENTEEAKVSLIEGDVLALLVGNKKDNQQLQVEVPGVRTKTNSRQFWIARDDQGARFANYDKEDFEVSSGGEHVVLKENYGTIVPYEESPSDPKQLLPAPRLLAPDETAKFVLGISNIMPTWEKIPGAGSYIMEMAQDQNFTDILWSQPFQGTTGAFPSHLNSGIFFWRVMAVSSDKLPGRSGEPRQIQMIKDNVPPFLVIRFPEQDVTVSEPQIEISGNTEEGIHLMIQEQPVTPEKDGEYRFSLNLTPGKNTIFVKATDSAGNTTEAERIIHYFPKSFIPLSFDPGLYQDRPDHFFVGQYHFALTGETEPGSTVTVTSATESSNPFSATSAANKKGAFQINIKLASRLDHFMIEIVSRSGKIMKKMITVEIDDTPPVILFDKDIPSATAQKKTEIAGTLEGGNYLELNGKEIPLQNNGECKVSLLKACKKEFLRQMELNPGVNHLNFLARDPVGNITKLVKEVFLDSEPPVITAYSFSQQNANGGESVHLTLQAKDSTGLIKAAPFAVEIGTYRCTGHMVRTGTNGTYSGTFVIPKNVKGKIRLKNVTLSDYLGNRKEWRMEN